MKKLFLASVAILLALPAYAGSITISVSTPSVTGSKTYTISDPDAASFLAFVQDAYPTRPNPAYVPSCVPSAGPPPVTCAPATLPNTTPLQALASWADGFAAGTVANVTNYLKAKAAATAVGGVAPVGIQ